MDSVSKMDPNWHTLWRISFTAVEMVQFAYISAVWYMCASVFVLFYYIKNVLHDVHNIFSCYVCIHGIYIMGYLFLCVYLLVYVMFTSLFDGWLLIKFCLVLFACLFVCLTFLVIILSVYFMLLYCLTWCTLRLDVAIPSTLVICLSRKHSASPAVSIVQGYIRMLCFLVCFIKMFFPINMLSASFLWAFSFAFPCFSLSCLSFV